VTGGEGAGVKWGWGWPMEGVGGGWDGVGLDVVLVCYTACPHLTPAMGYGWCKAFLWL